jgi:anti-repressor protein
MELQIFNNEEFGQVRSLMKDEEPWFVGKDVAAALGYKSIRDALARHVDGEDKGVVKHDTLGGAQELIVINESGLYSLVLKSKLPSAKSFKRWVTSEVLPQIRKTGGYIPIKQEDSELEIMSKAILIAQNTLAQKDALIAKQNEMIQQKDQTIQIQDNTIQQQKPLVDFAVHVGKTDDLIDMMSMAKLVSNNGIKMGRATLFDWLRDNKYFFKKSGLKEGNVPYQKYIDKGYFVVKENPLKLNSGRIKVTLTTYVTGTGQIYLLDKIKKYYENLY